MAKSAIKKQLCIKTLQELLKKKYIVDEGQSKLGHRQGLIDPDKISEMIVYLKQGGAK